MEEGVCEQVLGTWMGLWHRRRRRVPDRSEGTFRGRRDAPHPRHWQEWAQWPVSFLREVVCRSGQQVAFFFFLFPVL